MKALFRTGGDKPTPLQPESDLRKRVKVSIGRGSEKIAWGSLLSQQGRAGRPTGFGGKDADAQQKITEPQFRKRSFWGSLPS